MKKQIAWNKGLTKATDERVRKYGLTVSKTLWTKSPSERTRIAWNKGLTIETDKRVRKYGLTIGQTLRGRESPFKGHHHRKESLELISIKIREQVKTNPNFGTKGKHRSAQSKERISESRIQYFANGGQVINSKKYPIFCPYLNKELYMDDSWEYRFAKYLNDKKSHWVKGHPYTLQYRMNKTNHTYTPDFYIPLRNEYIEIKGNRFRNKNVMKKYTAIRRSNPNINLKILFDKDLKELGIL